MEKKQIIAHAASLDPEVSNRRAAGFQKVLDKMMKIKEEEVQKFQQEILEWYEVNKRDLPWREVPFDTSSKSRDPYSILISEIMLQQTQVPRVIPKFKAWMEKFSTIFSLSQASTSEVLRLWSGLGYNRRALYVQKTAQEIVRKYNGKFPQTKEELKQLPGIGEYTASAILCFAFNKQIALVDTNIRKVILLKFSSLIRHSGDPPDGGDSGISSIQYKTNRSFADAQDDNKQVMTDKEIQHIADRLLPKGVLRLRSGRLLNASAYEWNQALMDYSSEVLKKEKVPMRKQPHFLTSKRYVRGQIIKLLLAHNKISEKELIRLLEKKTVHDKATIKKILVKLEKEEFVVTLQEQVRLK